MKRKNKLMKGIADLTVGLMGGYDGRELIAEDIEQVRIAKSVSLGRFQEQAVVTYDGLEDVKVFADLIRNADEEPGIVNMTTPEYDVEIQYTSKETDRYYVWLGESGKSTSLMNVNDQNTVYRVPADVTDQLIRLFVGQ